MNRVNLKNEQGQLLLEVLVAVSASAAIVGLGAQLVFVSLQSNKVSGEKNVGLGLVEETFEAVRNVATERWQSVFTDVTPKNSNYYPVQPACISSVLVPGGGFCIQAPGKWVLTAGQESVTINTLTYTRSFTVQNVCRDNTTRNVTGITDTNGTTTTCATSTGTFDPSTQKTNVTVSWPNANPLTSSEYITRWRNDVCAQTSWAGGKTTPSDNLTACSATTYFNDDGKIDNTSVPGSIKILN